MTGVPDRKQGGVYIWTCALFASVLAVRTLVLTYNDFWIFLLAVALMLGVAGLSYSFLGFLIRRRAGTLEDEKGPLHGLVVVSGSVFILLLYMCFHINPHSHQDWRTWLLCSLSAMALATFVLFVGRMLNRYGMGLHQNSVLGDWSNMSEKAKAICLGAFPLFGAAILSVVVDILLHGLRLQIWTIVGFSIFAAGVFLSLTSLLRAPLYFLLVRPLLARRLNLIRYQVKKPYALWGDEFTLHELCATAAFSGIIVLFSLFFPQHIHSSYLLVISIGAATGVMAVVMICLFDIDHLGVLLQGQWRKEAVAFLLSKGYADNYKAALRLLVCNHFSESETANWDNAASIRHLADEVRRSLNRRFCEDGRMKYLHLSRCHFLDRREVVANYVGLLFDGHYEDLQKEGKLKMPEDMTDGQLSRKVSEVKKWQENDSMELDAGDVQKSITYLQAKADWSQIQPACRLALEFRNGDSIQELEIEFDSRRLVTLFQKDASGANVVSRFRLENLANGIADKVLRA